MSIDTGFFNLIIMPVTKAQKSEILEQLKKNMKEAKSVVFANYQGLSVKDLKKLRRALKEKGVEFQVAKKTLFCLAAKEALNNEIPIEFIEGPVGAAFSMEDEIAAAKILYKFGKTNENLKLRGAIFEGRVLSVSETSTLALIPSKEELLSKLVYLLKSPISRFHGVLYNTLAGLPRVLDAIKAKKA